jgi:hypothetical protein
MRGILAGAREAEREGKSVTGGEAREEGSN